MAIIEQVHQAQHVEALGTLAVGVAHDFNNVLAGIAAMSRQSEMEVGPVSIRDVVAEASRLLHATLPTSIETRVSIDCQGNVMGNATEIHQVVMNLCTNGAQAMHETGGTLHLELSESELGAEALASDPELIPGRYAVLGVRDTGSGISADALSRVFEPFFTTKGCRQGTGMGLSVVHGIVARAGGTVEVESEPGSGTMFRVLWPLVTDSVQAPAHAPHVTGSSGQETILFVDDEPMLANINRRILRSLGYEVVAHTSATSALEDFLTDPLRFDLLITDLAMPSMSGAELAGEVLQVRPGLPVIICSGHVDSETRRSLTTAGVRSFLDKPFRLHHIAETVREVLDAEH